MAHKPVMLVIMDGWGIREMSHGNAVKLGSTPNYDRWMSTLERAAVNASGEEVGLVPDQMGNSEVGHLNLGAGRVVYQDITRINIAIREETLARKPELETLLAQVKGDSKKLHLIGLVSDGGVHSHQDHLHALLKIAKDAEVPAVVHVITDGRDTPTTSGVEFVRMLQAYMDVLGHGVISTVSGRYYAMDRDKRWPRTQLAYDAIAFRKSARRAATAVEAIKASYGLDAPVTDEFILPAVIGNDDSLVIEPGDGLLFYNFRADRMRQIVQGFVKESVDGFEGQHIPGLRVLTMTEYMDDLGVPLLFEKVELVNTLAEWLSKRGLSQYHSAETEKYPHVTFFFNGRREEPWPGEDRKIVPSPKVATYDLQPEMSAYELMEATLARINSHDDDFILINFANPDMVGHTGVLEAAIKAVETVDECVGKLVDAVTAKGGAAIVTADHGNCERMVEELTSEAHTYHTTNLVSLFTIAADTYFKLRPYGTLADVAPTVLDLMSIEKPDDMTGGTLIEDRRPLSE